MVRLIHTLSILLIGFKVCSQVEKKAILLGVNQLIVPTKNNITFTLSPQIGYFVGKKVLLAGSIPPSNSSKTLNGIFVPADGYVKNKGLISPFIRTYLFDDARLQFYLQQSIDFYRFKSNIIDLQKHFNKVIVGTTFNLGLVYFIDKSTTLEFCYSRPLLKGSVEDFPLSRIPYLRFGLSYMWKRKH